LIDHDTPVTQVTPLTTRQLAVARAIATGKTNQQVARDLHITVKTAEYDVSQVFTRLGVDTVDTRADIAAAPANRELLTRARHEVTMMLPVVLAAALRAPQRRHVGRSTMLPWSASRGRGPSVPGAGPGT
jgi:DNA-binding CsgD family transcriptional regulator